MYLCLARFDRQLPSRHLSVRCKSITFRAEMSPHHIGGPTSSETELEGAEGTGLWAEGTGFWAERTGFWAEGTGSWAERTGFWAEGTGTWSDTPCSTVMSSASSCSNDKGVRFKGLGCRV